MKMLAICTKHQPFALILMITSYLLHFYNFSFKHNATKSLVDWYMYGPLAYSRIWNY